jgi:hemolysin activation/secretion protein
MNRSAIAFACLCASGLAGAQQVPPTAPAGTVPRTEDIRRGTEIDAPKPSGPALDITAPRREIEDAPGLSIAVSGYRIVGLTRLNPADIEPALSRYVGPGKSFQDLRDAVDEVKTLLARRGLPLAYVYLPEQQIRDGIVEIAVIEGRLGRVVLEVAPGSRVSEAALRRYTRELAPGSVITVAEIERVLFLLRDLYGIDVKSEFRSGTQSGTADLVVRVTPARRFEGLVEFDSAGARITGVFRLTAGVRWNSPLGRGDSLSARVIASTKGNLQIGLLSYATPVGSRGTKVGASLTGVNYRIDPDVVGVGIEGRGHVGTLFVLHPVARSRNFNLFAQAAIDAKRFQENTGGVTTRRNVDLLTAAVVGDSADPLFGGAVNSFSAALGHGRLDRPFNDLPVPPTVDRNFNKVGLSYSRLQQLPFARTLLLLRYNGQLAGNNLDPYEQFTLGGINGIRAFGTAEGAGDEGHQLTAEVRWSPDKTQFDSLGNIAVQAFFDWGTIRLFHDPVQAALAAGKPNRRTLGGPGIGVMWELPGSATARASLAWPTIGENINDPSRRAPRAYFVINKAL